MLKNIVKFAKKEFREKKPLSSRVLRVKEEKKVSILSTIPKFLKFY